MAPGDLCLYQGGAQDDTRCHPLPGILTLCLHQALPAETAHVEACPHGLIQQSMLGRSSELEPAGWERRKRGHPGVKHLTPGRTGNNKHRNSLER